MIIFLLEPEGEEIIVQEKELSEVAFLHPDTIADDPNTSVLITYLLERQSELHLEMDKTLNPESSLVIQPITYLRHIRRRGRKSEYTGITYFNDVIFHFVFELDFYST